MTNDLAFHTGRPTVAVTMGDPAGIGPELCLRALTDKTVKAACTPVVFGDNSVLASVAAACGLPYSAAVVSLTDWQTDPVIAGPTVIDCHAVDGVVVQSGVVDKVCGHAAYIYIESAIHAALRGDVGAVATAPIYKEALHLAGVPSPGHTEIFASLTKAFAIAISVIPLVGLIVFVTAKGGRAKGAAYTSGWFLSLWLATFALSWIGTAALSGSDGKPSTGVALLQGGLGVIFFAISVWFIANRPKDPSQVKQPGWMTAVDSTSAVVAFGIGAFGVVVNGKNLPLIVSAAVDFSLANLRVGQLVVVVTIFAFTGTMLAMLPLVYALIRPQSSAKLLNEMRTWLIAHNAPIMAAIFALMGVSFLGQAISAFGL